MDDNEKSSYTLNFTFEGDNTVVVSASSDGGRKKQLTYHINYEKARQGEKIGTAVWSVEMFTIGCGYLVYPQKVIYTRARRPLSSFCACLTKTDMWVITAAA